MGYTLDSKYIWIFSVDSNRIRWAEHAFLGFTLSQRENFELGASENIWSWNFYPDFYLSSLFTTLIGATVTSTVLNDIWDLNGLLM